MSDDDLRIPDLGVPSQDVYLAFSAPEKRASCQFEFVCPDGFDPRKLCFLGQESLLTSNSRADPVVTSIMCGVSLYCCCLVLPLLAHDAVPTFTRPCRHGLGCPIALLIPRHPYSH